MTETDTAPGAWATALVRAALATGAAGAGAGGAVLEGGAAVGEDVADGCAEGSAEAEAVADGRGEAGTEVESATTDNPGRLPAEPECPRNGTTMIATAASRLIGVSRLARETLRIGMLDDVRQRLFEPP
ncbi:hypothetical protein GCM10009738_09480 [Kitasatospora viridis]